MHQPECGAVENEAHLIGGRAVTRHAHHRTPTASQIASASAAFLLRSRSLVSAPNNQPPSVQDEEFDCAQSRDHRLHRAP
jgi:hypothetical protein